jgi:hypothetical protein
MPRKSWACKVDSNQAEIVKMWRKIGASVAITSAVGDGFPDTILGIRGENFLVEIKPDEKAKLTSAQVVFHQTWQGKICVVRSMDEALELITTGKIKRLI